MSAPVVAIDVRKVKASTARISAQARAIAAELDRAYTMRLTLDTEDAQHLVWLDGGTTQGQPARPVLRLTGRAREAATQAIVAKLGDSLRASKTLGMLPALVVGGYAIRAVYIDRLEKSGADLTLRPLSPGYLASKRRRGLDLRIGVATRQPAPRDEAAPSSSSPASSDPLRRALRPLRFHEPDEHSRRRTRHLSWARKRPSAASPRAASPTR
jgi:hypothetical protein